MSKLLRLPWYANGRPLIKRMDRWVTLKTTPSRVGQEYDWLGWDGWVRTDSGGPPAGDGDTTNAR